MLGIIRSILFYSVGLFLLSLCLPGLHIRGGIEMYILGGVALTVMNILIKPLLHIISLPVTIITLGLFSFIINAGILFLLTKFIPQISIRAFTLPSYAYKMVHTPQIALSLPLSFLFISFMLSFLVTILQWIT